MSIPWALAIPVVVFITLIGPIWLTFHYVTVWKRMRAGELGDGKVAIDREELQRLESVAQRLEGRISSLETILDNETPNWKQ
ncbi:MAG: phage shock protein B [Gammaproteobacteria bacterium]